MPANSSQSQGHSGGQFVAWQPQMPSYGGYNGNNSGGNRNNRNNNGNRFKSRNNYQQGSNYQQQGYQQGVPFSAGACQICGRDNHQAYSCYYRQNLNYRPPSYAQYGTSQNGPQFAQQGVQGSQFAQQGHGFGQGYSTQRPPQTQAQALMVSSDTGYQGYTPTFQGYSMPQQHHQIAYSPPSAYMGQPGLSGVSFPLAPTAPNPPTTPFASSTAVPWFFDSGASAHVTNNMNQISVPTNTAPTAVTVGNGQSVPVSHSGLSDQPSGSSGVLQSGTLSLSSFF